MTDALSGEDFVTAIEMIESSFGGGIEPIEVIADADEDVLRRTCLAFVTLVRLALGRSADEADGPVPSAVQSWLDGKRATVDDAGFSGA